MCHRYYSTPLRICRILQESRVVTVNIASLTMSACVKHFLSTLQPALKEERHFALMDGVAFPTVGSLVIVFRPGTRSDPCISSVHYFDHDYDFELPR